MNHAPSPHIQSTPPQNAPINPEASQHYSTPVFEPPVFQTSPPPIQAAVLAVDDDPAMLASIRRVLRRSKIDVCTATSGSGALKMLGPWLPELVLLDVSMPLMSGQTFLRRFRQKELLLQADSPTVAPPIPVMFVTGQSGQRQRIDGLNAGAIDYLVKPFDPDELRARVCSQLRHVRRTTQALITSSSPTRPTPSGAAA